MSVREAIVVLCPETWPKVYGWECGLPIPYFGPYFGTFSLVKCEEADFAVVFFSQLKKHERAVDSRPVCLTVTQTFGHSG